MKKLILQISEKELLDPIEDRFEVHMPIPESLARERIRSFGLMFDNHFITELTRDVSIARTRENMIPDEQYEALLKRLCFNHFGDGKRIVRCELSDMKVIVK